MKQTYACLQPAASFSGNSFGIALESCANLSAVGVVAFLVGDTICTISQDVTSLPGVFDGSIHDCVYMGLYHSSGSPPRRAT
jgi:hypothetical protein